MKPAIPGVSPETFSQVVHGYLACAAWADAPEGSNAQFTKKAEVTAAADCGKFIEACGPLFQQAIEAVGYSPSQFGHDFWLTRQGHGTGFWDRNELKLELEGDAPLATDRNGVLYPVAAELGKALSNIAFGTHSHISRFGHQPSVTASRGWLHFD